MIIKANWTGRIKMGTRLKYKAKWVDYEGFCKVKLGSKAKKSNKLSKFKFKFKN